MLQRLEPVVDRATAGRRKSCGHFIANDGTELRTIQDYMGHRDTKLTVRYSCVAGEGSSPEDDEAMVLCAGI